MAGAFTAQADDGSAMFHNIAGLGFQKEKGYTVGVTLINLTDSSFEGFDPFPGTGARAEIENLVFFPPHFYYVRPLTDNVTFGFGLNAPFGLQTEWKDGDNFPGRFLNLRAELQAVDLNAGVGWQVSDDLSLGIGLIARLTEVELLRRVPVLNPFNNRIFDGASVLLSSDMEIDFGFNAGILHKPLERFSWGFTYRGKVEADYSGDGRFEQLPSGNPVVDALVAGTIPFDQDLPITTSIEMPDTAILGFAFGVSRKVLLEVDFGWVGWDSFDQVDILFEGNPQFDTLLPQDWEDSIFVRIGAAVDTDNGQWRFGYVFDESPQPDEGVGPLLPDADRDGFTIGYGWDRWDLSFMYLDFGERETRVNRDNFNGRYTTDALLFGVTYRF